MRDESAGHRGLQYAALVLILGSTWLPVKLQSQWVRPEVSVCHRLILASLLLFGWCRLRGYQLRLDRGVHGRIALFGILTFAASQILLYVATAYAVSGVVAVVFSAVIVFNVLNGALVLGRRPELPILAGAALGVIGLLLVFVEPIRSAADSIRVEGLAACLAAALCYSIGNIVAASPGFTSLPVPAVNAYAMLHAAALVAIYSWLRGVDLAVPLSWYYIGPLLYLASIGSAASFCLYVSLLSTLGPERTAFVHLLAPIVALLASAGFEDVPWSMGLLAGTGLVLAGNAVSLWSRSSRRAVAR